MGEYGEKSGKGAVIAGILLIGVLILGVKGIFWGLDRVLPKPAQPPESSQSQQQETKAPSFCLHCGEGLPESFQWGQFCPYCGEKVE